MMQEALKDYSQSDKNYNLVHLLKNLDLLAFRATLVY